MQQEFKHTPGPWKVRFMNPKEPQESDFFVEAKNNNMPDLGYGIEIMGDDYGKHNGYPREQRLADAKLIAAAPLMLDALDELYRTMVANGDDLNMNNVTKFKVQEALKKATE